MKPGRTGDGHPTVAGPFNSGAVPNLLAVTGIDGIDTSTAAGTVTVSQHIAAEWPIANIRVYAVDGVNGNDANLGYADAAGTSAAQYQAACAAAGAVAKQTIAGLAAIFPRVGNGRLVEIVIANGGVNTQFNYADSLAIALNGSVGWGSGCPEVRATGTQPNASSVAFAGNNAEIDYCGGVTSAAFNAAGYNPTGVPTTTVIQMLKVGGAAPLLPAEPAAPLGFRIRFNSATATVALRGICRQICRVSGTDTVEVQTALPAVPVAGDVFYIEQAGVVCPAFTLGNFGLGTVTSGAQLCGIRSTGSIALSDSHFRLIFCGANALQGLGLNLGLVTQNLLHPVAGSRTVGGGFRSETTVAMNLASGQLGVLAGLVSVGAQTLAFATQLNWGAGSYCGGVYTMQNCQLPVGTDVNTTPNLGINSGTATPRIATRLLLTAVYGQLGALVISGAGASPAIRVGGQSVIVFAQGVVSGATGNNDVGLDLTNARGSLIVLATTPTVTGALGDVRLAGGQIVTWAQAIATGIVDSAGNRIIGTAGVPPQGNLKFTGAIIGGVGPVFAYLADTSPVLIVANEIIPVRYPTSFRLMTRLRVLVIGDTSVNIIPLTLYKNGVATAMVVNIPAGSAGFTKLVDAAHPILFLDGDDYALRLDDAADPGGALVVVATLEYAA